MKENKIYIIKNSNVIHSTFTFDKNTGQVINEVNTDFDNKQADFLIQEAEKIKNNPDSILNN